MKLILILVLFGAALLLMFYCKYNSPKVNGIIKEGETEVEDVKQEVEMEVNKVVNLTNKTN